MTLAALGVCAVAAVAQDKPAETPRRGGNPIIAALDANHDGVIDAAEISNAPAALKKLDKNGDGKLTRQEFRNAGAGKDGEKPKRKANKE